MVGAEQHKGAVINLHKVYLSMMIELEKDLHILTNDDMSLAREIDSLLDKIKSKLSTDLNELFPEVHIGEKYLESFHFESLNEAQAKKCHQCYLHSLLNEKALIPRDLYDLDKESYT